MAPGGGDCVEHGAAQQEPTAPAGCARGSRRTWCAVGRNGCYTPPVPLLNAADRLPIRPNRVLVAGTSGAGKSTLAARLAGVLGLEYVEIDGLFHGPGWVPREEFMQDVERFAARLAWVTEWQYHTARPLLAERADLLVWLDYPRHVVMRRVVARTVRRRVANEELWNGNREQGLWRIFVDREHIIRWAWRTHSATPQRVAELVKRRPELAVVRLRSPAECEEWVARLARCRN